MDPLFASILKHPEDDTARLVYADYLDELDPVRVTCRLCQGDGQIETGILAGGDWEKLSPQERVPIPVVRCPSCSGTGTVRDESAADLAELIRVQIRETNPPWSSTDMIRERELLDRHPEWLRTLTMPCPGCEVETVNAGKVRRVPCPTCDETGDLLRYFPGEGEVAAHGEPIEGSNLRNPALTRGLTLRVGCRLDEVVREVDIGGTFAPGTRWQPTPWALAFRAACVAAGRVPWWRVTDLNPFGTEWSGRYLWFEDDGGRVRDGRSVPRPIFDTLPGNPVPLSNYPRSQKIFPTADAARHALELALYTFVLGKKDHQHGD